MNQKDTLDVTLLLETMYHHEFVQYQYNSNNDDDMGAFARACSLFHDVCWSLRHDEINLMS
jgi:hypothetical protein